MPRTLLSPLLTAKFLRFALVGGATALVYAGGIFLFLHLLALDYRLGISLAYILAVSFHFLCNRAFTFAGSAADSGLSGQVLRYCCLLLLNYGIVLAVAVVCVDSLGLSAYLASGLSLCVTTLLAYVLLNRWVFRPAPAGAPAKPQE